DVGEANAGKLVQACSQPKAGVSAALTWLPIRYQYAIDRQAHSSSGRLEQRPMERTGRKRDGGRHSGCLGDACQQAPVRSSIVLQGRKHEEGTREPRRGFAFMPLARLHLARLRIMFLTTAPIPGPRQLKPSRKDARTLPASVTRGDHK